MKSRHHLLLLSLILASCGTDQDNTLFTTVSPSRSGVHFENRLDEDDDFNIIEYLYFYNGGGIAAGDIDNDGLCDLYFSANQLPNKLYLNKGNFTFEDITLSAGAEGPGGWKTGVSMADVNADGLLDIFICGVGSYKKFEGRNQLLINNGDLTFRDATEEYGLSFQGFSTQAAFFDYDNDGDLDMYLVNHSVHSVRSYGDVSYRHMSDRLAGDKLYRNEHAQIGRPFFTEVTTLAGIYNSQIGYGLAVAISDVNRDGFQDIYVSNDFHENDYLYINQRDGTFRQELEVSMKHTSRFSMGSAAADINNDGWIDILTLDMLPADETVILSTAGEDPYDIYEFKLRFGYHPQYSRNALQLNLGKDGNGRTRFTEIACYAGIEATDWSWAPLVADFDNDGFKDLFVTSGIVGRPNDLDYISYISKDSAQRFYSDKQLSSKMPDGKAPSVMFRNKGRLRFEKTVSWIDSKPGYVNGAVYADLDNDGDLDLATNNLNATASLLRNNDAAGGRYLRLKLSSAGLNRFAVGARAELYINSVVQVQELTPVAGWESSSEPLLHFGLGQSARADSLVLLWPNGVREVRRDIEGGSVLVMSEPNPGDRSSITIIDNNETLVNQIVKDTLFVHKSSTFSPFETQRLLPHGLSMNSPQIAVADIDGDGKDDFFVGGGAGQPGVVFLVKADGSFTRLNQPGLWLDRDLEDAGCALADLDGDGKADLVVGQQNAGGSGDLQLRLYINNGKGVFVRKGSALPEIEANVSVISPADIDGDGDNDLFIGSQFETDRYGISPKSYLLINDGKGNFTDQTLQWFHAAELGMISDALWTDVNSDGKPDLVVAGFWMPVSIYLNDGKKLDNATEAFGLGNTSGWWSALAAADMDNDGDIDLIGGNAGLNMRLRADAQRPVELFVSDIDGNGSVEQILTHYNGDVRYPFVSRDQLIRQVPPLKRKFLKYSDYAKVKIEDIVPVGSEMAHLKVEQFASIYFESVDGRSFKIHELPAEVQLSSIHAILVDDADGDGVQDLFLGGNTYDMQPEIGRLDGGYGLVLTGDGKGGFDSKSIRSGFVVDGQVRAIEHIATKSGRFYLVARHNESMLVFKKRK